MRSILTLTLLFALACGDDDDTPGPSPDMAAFDAGEPLDMGGPDDGGPLPDAPPQSPDMGAACFDETPDDTLETAQDLGSIEANAGFPVDTVSGDIDPITDVDWFMFHDTDVLTGDVQPRYSLAATPAGMIWELCMYFECDSGDTSFDCPAGANPHTASGVDGCCVVSTEGAASITLSPSCSGTIDEDGTAWARVSRQGGMVDCEGGYELSYGDD